MSKGWCVKVETNVIFSVDTNVGVLAECEREAAQVAQKLVCDWIDREDYKAELEQALPWELYLGGQEWNRGSQSGDIDFDTMQAISVEPDSDFDPEETSKSDLMDAAMCLLEVFWNLPEDDLRKSDFLPNHGIAVVRDRMAVAANLCHQTWSVMVQRDEYDDCFDWDFCPRFFENCMDHQMVLKSGEVHELIKMWKEE